ncbi:GNAT family N-acetyltransferase [Spirochaeta dissipatitropha]
MKLPWAVITAFATNRKADLKNLLACHVDGKYFNSMHNAFKRLEFRFHDSMADIDPDGWNRIGSAASFLIKHSWLASLEKSRSVSPSTDWSPLHALTYDGNKLIAGMPMYLRSKSSEGEFVFDYPWIQAAEQLGLPYFPKLVGMSPATPIPAQDILLDESWCREMNVEPVIFRRWFLSKICQHAQETGIGSIHLQFTRKALSTAAVDLGFGTWEHFGFSWENSSFRNFDDFLQNMTKDRRRNARRERRRLADSGIRFRMFQGHEAESRLLDTLYTYYVNTTNQFGPWAARYLNRDFFMNVLETAADNLLICAAYKASEEEPVGISMMLIDGKRLLGRYWGCREQVEFLHFACCYYEPIEWAINHGMQSFNPGMGGEHKIHRGFKGCTHYSHHWFRDDRMRWLFHANIHQFNDFTKEQIQESVIKSPLKISRSTVNAK